MCISAKYSPLPECHRNGVAELLLGPERVKHRLLHKEDDGLHDGLGPDGSGACLIVVGDQGVGVLLPRQAGAPHNVNP